MITEKQYKPLLTYSHHHRQQNLKMYTFSALLVLCSLAFGDACQCGEVGCDTITTPTTFQSPNYPEAYDQSEDCTATIIPPADKCIRLSYREFYLNENLDFLYIRGDGQLIQAKTGETESTNCLDVVDLDLYSEITLQFTSHPADWSVNGFDMDITFIECPVPYPTCTCGSCDVITDTTTVISPNFPDPIYEYTECVFTVDAPEGQCFRMEFAYINLELYDYLYMYGDEDYHYYEYISGTKQSSTKIIAGLRNIFFQDSGSAVPITDVPDGFQINFVLTSECQLSTTYQCEVTDPITSGPTVVTSKHYPLPYDNWMDCSTEIIPPPGMRAEIQFNDIAIQRTSDYLYIYENGNEMAKIDGEWCGNSYPPYIGGIDSPLVVRFTSDDAVTYQGFEYTVDFFSLLPTVMTCPTGFTEHLPQKCYKIVHDVNLSQPDAKAACEATHGARLFRYDSVEEFTTIRKMVKKSAVYKAQPRFWTGLVRENIETTTWTWGPGGEVIAPADAVWGKAEPNNKAGNEVCSNMLKLRGFKLNDANCDKTGGYICKVTLREPSTPEPQ